MFGRGRAVLRDHPACQSSDFRKAIGKLDRKGLRQIGSEVIRLHEHRRLPCQGRAEQLHDPCQQLGNLVGVWV